MFHKLKLFGNRQNKREGVLAGLRNNPAKKDPVELFLSKNRPNCRLKDQEYEDTYGVFIRRSVQIMRYVGADADVEPMLDELGKMCKYRRGVTLPSNMVAYQLQRYWDIVTFSLVTMYLVRIVSDKCTGVGIQVSHAGEIYTFAPYQDYLHNAFQKIGVVDTDSSVMGSDVLLATRLNVLNDLLFKSPIASQWFGMFPDMLRLIFRHLEGLDEVVEVVFGVIVDRFVGSFKEAVLTPDTNKKDDNGASPKLKTFALPNNSPDKTSSTSTAEPVQQNPSESSPAKADKAEVKQKLTMTPELSAAFSRASVGVSEPGKKTQTAQAAQTSTSPKKVEKLGTKAESKSSQCEKSEQGRGGHQQSKPNLNFQFKSLSKLKAAPEPEGESEGESFDCIPVIKDVLRDISSNKALYKKVVPISRDSGEIGESFAIMIAMSSWRVAVAKLGHEGNKHDLLNYLKNERKCYSNSRGGIELNGGEEIVMLVGCWLISELGLQDIFVDDASTNVEFDDICLRM